MTKDLKTPSGSVIMKSVQLMSCKGLHYLVKGSNHQEHNFKEQGQESHKTLICSYL